MDEDTGTGGSAVSGDNDPEQIRADIEATREQLGDTVEALTAKTDVKAQAKHKIDETREQVGAKADDLLGKAREASPETAATAASNAGQKARENPVPVAAIGAFVVGFLAGRISAR